MSLKHKLPGEAVDLLLIPDSGTFLLFRCPFLRYTQKRVISDFFWGAVLSGEKERFLPVNHLFIDFPILLRRILP